MHVTGDAHPYGRGLTLCAVMACWSVAAACTFADADAPFAEELSAMGEQELLSDLSLTLTISSPKTTLLPNEPLALDWRITYAGDETIWVVAPDVKVHITEPDGDGYDVKRWMHVHFDRAVVEAMEPGCVRTGGKLLQIVSKPSATRMVIPFARPGVYQVQCRLAPALADPETRQATGGGRPVHSNVLTVTVKPAKGRDAEAGALYRTVMFGVYGDGQVSRDASVSAAERLVAEFGDTVFGLYQRQSRVAAASEHGVWEASRGGQGDLRRAQQSRVEMFEAFVRDAEAADFPLLDSAMQQLAQAYLSAHMEAEAQEICDAMRKRFSDSHHTEHVERLLRGEEDPPVP